MTLFPEYDSKDACEDIRYLQRRVLQASYEMLGPGYTLHRYQCHGVSRIGYNHWVVPLLNAI